MPEKKANGSQKEPNKKIKCEPKPIGQKNIEGIIVIVGMPKAHRSNDPLNRRF